MYLEIDEGYWEHPKTLDLCARLGDDQADSFPPRLWKWACRCARDGRLGKITAYAFERVVRYAPSDGKCFAAFLSSGLIDQDEAGEVAIHNWMNPGRTGHAIAKMEAKAEENRQRRADSKAKHEARREQGEGVPEPYPHRTSTNPSQTRPGTDQAQSPDLSLRAREGEPGVSSHDWLSFFAARWWEARGRQYGQGEADARAAARMGEVLATLPATERAADWEARGRMVEEFLSRSDKATREAGWSFAFFVAGFNGFRIPESERPSDGRKREEPKTWKVMER